MHLCAILGHKFSFKGSTLDAAFSRVDKTGYARVLGARWCYREEAWILPPLDDKYLEVFLEGSDG